MENKLTGAVSWGLDGHLAVVTGCASGAGIGLATAWQLAQGGAQVIGIDIAEPEAEPDFPLLRANLAIPAEVNDVIDDIIERFGVPTLLCNVAGGEPRFLDPQRDEWELTIATNLTTARLVSERIYPLMPAGSAIINVSSLAGVVMGFDPAYAAAKAGVLGLTRSHARLLGPRGVRVNCVVPGVVDTRLWGDEGIGREWIDSIPLGRAAKAEDVAQVIAFLCSSAAAYVNGAALFVDGGLSIALGPSQAD